MSDEQALDGTFMVLAIDDCIPNEWNPNEMDSDTLNRLAEEIEEVGFIDPIQVIEIDVDGETRYQILGGEHRWKASKFSGKDTIPAIVLNSEKWQSTDLRKFVTMRLNMLRGKLNPQKFAELWSDLSRRHKAEDMQRLMAFTDQKAYNALVKNLINTATSSGLPEHIGEAFKKKIKDEVMTIEGISKLLHDTFQKYGDTVPFHFLFFDFGGKQHLQVQCDKDLWEMLQGRMLECQDAHVSAKDLMKAALSDVKIADLPKTEPSD